MIVKDFIEEMNFAYSASNLIIARAGATTIAELLTLEIPAALVPSPNVAANHQYYNAKSLADQNAAVLVEDHLLKEKLKEVVMIIFNEKKLNDLRMNAKKINKPDAAEIIAESAIRFAESYERKQEDIQIQYVFLLSVNNNLFYCFCSLCNY